LDVARAAMSGQSEYFWRAAVVHAYYALFLECRDLLFSWGQKHAHGQNIHAWTRLRLAYAGLGDLKTLADALDQLVRLRNKASYELTATPLFASAAVAQRAIQMAEDALTLLDEIDADPARRSAAIASLPP
jgi:hypothetical protein